MPTISHHLHSHAHHHHHHHVRPILTYVYNSQPSRAVRWFIAKHKIDATLNPIPFAELHSPQVAKRNPWQQVPFLELGNRVLTESGAILEYLAGTHNIHDEYPLDEWSRAKIREMFYKHENLARKVTIKVVRPLASASTKHCSLGDSRHMVHRHADEVVAALDDIEEVLAGHKYFAGPTFSLADYLPVCELNQLPAIEAAMPGFLPEKLIIEHNFPRIDAYLKQVTTDDALCDTHLEEFRKLLMDTKAHHPDYHHGHHHHHHGEHHHGHPHSTERSAQVNESEDPMPLL